MEHVARRIRGGQYEYRGFRIDDSYSSRWQIMVGDVHGWLAAANTLRAAKSRIDHWYEVATAGGHLPLGVADAIASIEKAVQP